GRPGDVPLYLPVARPGTARRLGPAPGPAHPRRPPGPGAGPARVRGASVPCPARLSRTGAAALRGGLRFIRGAVSAHGAGYRPAAAAGDAGAALVHAVLPGPDGGGARTAARAA